MEDNLDSVMERRSYVELANNGGYFSKFSYISDPYDEFKKALTERRKEHTDKMLEVGKGAPFLNQATRSKPHKHESYFQSL